MANRNKVIDNILERLDDTLNTPLAKTNTYQELQNYLRSDVTVSLDQMQELLAICIHDLKEDVQFAANALTVISAILVKQKTEQYPSKLDLVPSAIAILNFLKYIIQLSVSSALEDMCFEVMQSYPDNTLIDLALLHSTKVIDLIKVYCEHNSVKRKRLAFEFLYQILKTLPLYKRETFAKDGIDTWFNVIVPAVIKYSVEPATDITIFLEVIEILADSLANIDFTENTHWKNILKHIYTPERYPLVMKRLLEQGNCTWHRLWIVFIKLLKNQITRVSNSSGSPINAMLPVVELAFKMDAVNRCRAFQCWKVLIDNFSSELNEAYVVKRIKLLIIPLRSNNAKVEETALAKLDTWWHLITKFHTKIDNFTDLVFIPFLHFCFGKQLVTGKTTLTPGQFSDKIKRQCAQLLVEIVGHVNCEGCVTVPKLKSRLISIKLLVDHWNDWIHALKSAIEILTVCENELAMQQARCLWQAIVMTVGELPENNVRKDLFNNILAIIDQLLEKQNPKITDIIFNVLICSLFNEQSTKQLLKAKDEDKTKEPLHIILTCLLNPLMNDFYSCQETKDLVRKLKPIAKFIMEEAPSYQERILNDMTPNDKTLMMWSALAEALCESNYDFSAPRLCEMVMWPLNSWNAFSDEKLAQVWYNWYTLYNLIHPKLWKKIDSNIITFMTPPNRHFIHLNIFLLIVAVALLKHKLSENNADIGKEADILLNILNNVEELKQIEEGIPVLIDTLVQMLNVLTESVSLCVAEKTLTAVKTVMIVMFMTKGLKTPDDIRSSKFILFIENLLQPIATLLKIESYSILQEEIADHMIMFSHLLNEEHVKPLKKTITSILKTILSSSQEGSNLYVKTKAAVDTIEKKIENEKETSNEDQQNKFPAPEAKAAKKFKKREASIVNTVVENGEEYVVVKSNWKFNPKKLTENQKEKLKRKREDIPALYQDLSQSQDEFKLTTWKTDSCDVSSTTSSKSNSKSANEDISTILKNIPSSNVVPTIIEKMFSENANNERKVVDEPTKKQASPALKEPKTPRLALKDRVFRNVRNLIEKSGKQNDVKLISEDLNQTDDDNTTKTPPTKAKNIVNLINSAPPNINSERPSRVIKKPKKFDDTEVFAIKKRNRSQTDSHPDIEPGMYVKETTKDDQQCPVNDELPEPVLTSREITVNETQNVECAQQNSNACNNEVIDLLGNTEMSQPIEEANEMVTDGVKYIELKDGDKCTELKKGDMCSGDSALGEDKDKPLTDSRDFCPIQETSTPKPSKSQESDTPKSSVKKKRSRIEKQLLIDMVEGHPFLQVQSEKRVTRKNLLSPVTTPKRKSLAEKFNKTKSDTNTKTDKKFKEKHIKDRNSIDTTSPSTKSVPDAATALEPRISDSSDDLPMSEDVIESSQDSTITTISVKSTKSAVKKIPIVVLQNPNRHFCDLNNTQNLLNEFKNDVVPLKRPLYQESKDDIELPENKTIADEKTEIDLTENMDTEPLEPKDSSSDVIVISNDVVSPIVINTENIETVSEETQEIADADTQPMDIDSHTVNIVNQKEFTNSVTQQKHVSNDTSIITIDSQDDGKRETIDFSVTEKSESTNICSPFKDDVQRKKDFLNDTIEISPIKTLSPVRDNKSPSPETSSDYVVIKLASPVQNNGEPYEKCDSPEIFTEDKVSPDMRDQSPPRAEVVVNDTSPTSSLSLKKNRPQVRSTCRGAQMLSLCAPDKLQAIMNSERSAESDEPKKSSNTPVRRNLRILYSSVADNSEKCDESDTIENFLKFKKALPTADCSPSGPILKRKLVDIADEATISPASKRKRVSFHDPPVSTTIAVQKYIEPGLVRSPQSSALKRLERQLRTHANMKSPKRLDTEFTLDTVLNKAVECFSGDTSIVSEDIAMSSLDQTPSVEIIKTSDLNDTDPICPELLNCNDPIDNIAGELSSPAMKALLITELTGKVETIADLAKMTELEVNRLCIKAPKVKVAKKVLTDYASKKANTQEQSASAVEPSLEMPVVVEEIQKVSIEVQTNEVMSTNSGMQTEDLQTSMVHTQTVPIATSHTGAQTDESGVKSTKDLISSCLKHRPDFIEQLSAQLEEPSIQKIANNLSFNAKADLLMKEVTASNATEILNRVVENQCNVDLTSGTVNMSFLQDYLCNRLESKHLIMFCSQLLMKLYDKQV